MKKILLSTFLIFTFLGLQAQLTTQQIGSSSNAYTALLNFSHPLSLETGTGTNGGSLVFIHRENTTLHPGPGASSGKLRYAISTDGGTTWATEKGVVNPTFTEAARYPNSLLFNKNGGSTIADLRMTYVCPSLNATPTWDGHANGLVSNLTSATPTVNQELYRYVGTADSTYIPSSLTERVQGEFWYCNFQFDGARLYGTLEVHKGVYSSTGDSILWTREAVISPDYNVTGPGSIARYTSPHIAFSPDGTKGYIAFLGDITGGKDSVYLPVFIESTNGGQTWGTEEEVDLDQFLFLSDSLQTGISSGNPSFTFNADLTVDSAGHPHLFGVLGNTPARPSYNVQTITGGYRAVDVTQDSAGNWALLHIAHQLTQRGSFGTGTAPSATFVADPWIKISRTASGNKIFYAWTDTDTSTAGWLATNANGSPDLLGRALDLSSGNISPINNWTGGVFGWSGAALVPQASSTVIENAGDYIVPTVFLKMDGTDALQPVSHHYTSDVKYRDTSFSQTSYFFPTCRANPVAGQLIVNDAICGLVPGSVQVTALQSIGGAPYTYQWSGGQSTDSISVQAGQYTLLITDNYGCTGNFSATINDIPGPAIDSASSTIISCNGGSNGTAFIQGIGGRGVLTYQWSTTASTQSVQNLVSGIYNVAIIDTNGCRVDTSFLIVEPPRINGLTNANDPLCQGESNGSASVAASGGTPGYTYLWSNGSTGLSASGLAAGMYNVTISDTNSCSAMFSVTLADPSTITTNPFISDPTCNAAINGSITVGAAGGTPGYTYLWSTGATTNTLSGLGAGVYSVSIKDNNNCTLNDTFTLSQPDVIAITDSVTVISCFGMTDGAISVLVTGGTLNYSYQWSNGGSGSSISNLGRGTYALTIVDANQCSKVKTFRLTEPAKIQLSAQIRSDNGTANGSITINPSGGTAPFQYNWNTGATTASITGLSSGFYILTATDSNRCSVTDTFIVHSNVGIEDELASGFLELTVSPNPAREQIVVRFGLLKMQAAEVAILDLNGRKIRSQRHSSDKQHSFSFVVDDLAEGIYFVKIQTPQGIASRRLVVQ